MNQMNGLRKKVRITGLKAHNDRVFFPEDWTMGQKWYAIFWQAKENTYRTLSKKSSHEGRYSLEAFCEARLYGKAQASIPETNCLCLLLKGKILKTTNRLCIEALNLYVVKGHHHLTIISDYDAQLGYGGGSYEEQCACTSFLDIRSVVYQKKI